MKFEEIELRLKTLVEIHLSNLLPGQKNRLNIAHKLASAMHSNLRVSEEGEYAPNIYVIVGHPSILDVWNLNEDVLDDLAAALESVAAEAGYGLSSKPIVTTAFDESLKPGRVNVLASFRKEQITQTQGMDANGQEDDLDETALNNAFLIIGGTDIRPLNQQVTNIGRRLDNHIVIDDPRVSRNHAQLRYIRNRFVVFDLNSTGGTFVNNDRTNQSVLFPGDVISLAGVTLIFGQELPSAHGDQPEKTKPVSNVPGGRTKTQFTESEDLS